MAFDNPITPVVPPIFKQPSPKEKVPGAGFGNYGATDFKRSHGEVPLEAGREANLQTITDQGAARGSQYAQEAGLNEQQQAEEQFQVNQSQAVLRASMQETSWVHGLTQLGFDEKFAMTLLQEHQRSEQEHQQEYVRLVTTLAKLVVTVAAA